MSKVSASGFTPYFFIIPGSDNSVRGTNAAMGRKKGKTHTHTNSSALTGSLEDKMRAINVIGG